MLLLQAEEFPADLFRLLLVVIGNDDQFAHVLLLSAWRTFTDPRRHAIGS
jgi:hypothetical protein